MDTLTGHARAAGFGEATWAALGCTARLLVRNPECLPAARATVDAVVTAVEEAASRFRDSELTRLPSDGADIEVSPMLAHLIRVALDAARWSGGLLDPTVGAAMDQLGYDRTFRLVPSDGPPISVAAQPVPGWQQVSLQGARLRLPAGVRLDLGATAKSVAADLAARDAAEACGCGVLVGLGGDIAVGGPAPAGGWPIAVTDIANRLPGDATDHDEAAQTVAVSAGGIATSGVLARRWRRGGSVLHHLLDPRTGLPAQGPWRTVSVTAPTCVLAGAAATTAVIRGATAPRWLSDLELPARLVAHDGTVTTTAGWPQR